MCRCQGGNVEFASISCGVSIQTPMTNNGNSNVIDGLPLGKGGG